MGRGVSAAEKPQGMIGECLLQKNLKVWGGGVSAAEKPQGRGVSAAEKLQGTGGEGSVYRKKTPQVCVTG